MAMPSIPATLTDASRTSLGTPDRSTFERTTCSPASALNAPSRQEIRMSLQTKRWTVPKKKRTKMNKVIERS